MKKYYQTCKDYREIALHRYRCSYLTKALAADIRATCFPLQQSLLLSFSV